MSGSDSGSLFPQVAIQVIVQHMSGPSIMTSNDQKCTPLAPKSQVSADVGEFRLRLPSILFGCWICFQLLGCCRPACHMLTQVSVPPALGSKQQSQTETAGFLERFSHRHPQCAGGFGCLSCHCRLWYLRCPCKGGVQSCPGSLDASGPHVMSVGRVYIMVRYDTLFCFSFYFYMVG